MTWFITHKPAYDTDFIELPKNLQKQATQAHADLARDPVTPRGNTIKKLKGWANLWRYRLGNYRLIYAAAPESQVVQLLAIGPRAAVYRRFNYEESSALSESADAKIFSPELAASLEPQRAAGPTWPRPPVEPQPQRPAEPLPRPLDAELLATWRIPAEHRPALLACQTADDLLQADLPAELLSRVLDALWPPPVERLAGQPDQRLFQPEDLERYAEGGLHGFLLHLDEAQRRLVDWALTGPTLIKGGPGSGKSTIALYRVRAIIEQVRQEGQPLPEILFTTYTNALTNVSESLLTQLVGDLLKDNDGAGVETSTRKSRGKASAAKLPKSIRVTTVDATATWIVRQSGLTFELAGPAEQLEALRYARTALRPRELGDLAKLQLSEALQKLRDDYLLEEFDWIIEGQNCAGLGEYLQANRAGRAIPFDAELRTAVWQLYQGYRTYLGDQQRLTWGQLRQLALARVRAGEFAPRWDYVIIDEAQDLPPTALALCLELCRTPAGLFLTADANQSLYNRGFRWQSVHEQLKVAGRTRILRHNYRNTREIAGAAAEFLPQDDSADSEALQQSFIHVGPPPVIYAADGAADQARWLAEQIQWAAQDLRLPISAAAVLAPSNSLGQPLAELLTAHGLPARFLSGKDVRLEERCVKVLTLHTAKGLEFPIVAIAHLEADRIPRELDTADAQDIEEHHKAQRRLLYVGCTRAMRYLFITHDRSLPSPFLQQLSEDCWLWL